MCIRDRPQLLARQPTVFWGLVASMYIGNVILLILNLPLVGLFARLLRMPRWVLLPGVAVLSATAVFAINQSAWDLVLMVAFGVVGYVFRKAAVPLAPAILGVVLGPLMEKNLRRSLALSGGDWGVLFSSTIALAFWMLAALFLLGPSLLAGWKRFHSAAASRS